MGQHKSKPATFREIARKLSSDSVPDREDKRNSEDKGVEECYEELKKIASTFWERHSILFSFPRSSPILAHNIMIHILVSESERILDLLENGEDQHSVFPDLFLLGYLNAIAFPPGLGPQKEAIKIARAEKGRKTELIQKGIFITWLYERKKNPNKKKGSIYRDLANQYGKDERTITRIISRFRERFGENFASSLEIDS